MASNKAFPLPTAHTAGIFADLSVDGPVIGTLVAIVDRAKNLPNRKTIGKQDPYCAARLGKEAKKTSTDIRGGQTPKWDQELRFTVHDSADYYQLKISVFTDDKKTDLIGEAWVDLKNIVVPGGGQKDIWQNLTCRGKYAGEIRVEITYYDSRPKPEKPTVKARHSTAADLESTPPKPKGPMKRRPLPSDPVTGEAPAVNSVPATPDYYQTPPRHAKQPSQSTHIPAQSPLQSVEYGHPAPASHHRQQSEQYPPAQVSPAPYIPQQNGYRHAEQHDAQSRHYDSHHSPEPRSSHSSLPELYSMGPRDSRQSLPPDDARPPPPPAHRSRHNSSGQNSFETSPTKMPMRHDVLRNEAHRNSAPSYPGQPTYRAFESAPPAAYAPFQAPEHEGAVPRHHSHDGTHEPQYRTMQPTVEDAPESPTGSAAFRQSASRRPHPDEMGYEVATSPAPLNLSRSPVASPHHAAVSPMQTPGAYEGHSPAVSPLASRDFSTSPGQGSYHTQGQYMGQRQRHEIEPAHFQSSSNYDLPALPASLVPGVDPALSQEVADRIYEERRGDGRYSAPMATPSRGRQQSEPPMSYGYGGAASPHGYQPQGYDRRSGVSYGTPEHHPQHRQQRHSVSPVPVSEAHHTIRRKSVSPIPPPVEERRSSEVPFGPDDFDAFNPAMQSSREATPLGGGPEKSGKIITHDGKEVDPSDHLPVESWAPEPEPKPPSSSTDTRTRPMLSGAQPMPSSGRKQMRLSRVQPQQPAPSPSAGYNFSGGEVHTPPAPASTGRNRLTKRTNRASAVPSPAASSPLAPISPDNYQDRQAGSPYTPTRGLPRAQTWDYPSENHSPHHHAHSPGYGPPIPAKVPLMSGANMGHVDERSLAEELQSIDIGAGRSRRRGGY